MLNIKRSITLKGESIIDGVKVEGYSASIDGENPEGLTFGKWFTSEEAKAIYKANRTQCRKDVAEFEDAAYALQDEMLAEKK